MEGGEEERNKCGQALQMVRDGVNEWDGNSGREKMKDVAGHNKTRRNKQGVELNS
jgi:hypothetical protein